MNDSFDQSQPSYRGFTYNEWLRRAQNATSQDHATYCLRKAIRSTERSHRVEWAVQLLEWSRANAGAFETTHEQGSAGIVSVSMS
jgi:hypothetical protein